MFLDRKRAAERSRLLMDWRPSVIMLGTAAKSESRRTSLDDLLAASGVSVVVEAGHTELFQMLMADAEGSVKNPDGGWTLTFAHDNPEIMKKIEDLKKKHPEGMAISASREKLEDFFFRTVENANV